MSKNYLCEQDLIYQAIRKQQQQKGISVYFNSSILSVLEIKEERTQAAAFV